MFEDRKILVVEDSKHDIDRIESLLGELKAIYKLATSVKGAVGNPKAITDNGCILKF